MGMCILIRRASMGGPAGMTDAKIALDGVGLTGFGQFEDSPAFFPYFEAFAIKNCKSSGVVAPVFQPVEGIEKNRLGASRSHVGDNSTHRKLVLPPQRDRVKR